MTRRDLLDDHFDDFGAQLSAAASGKQPGHSPVRRTWVRPAIGVGGLTALGAGVAAVTLFPVAGKVDVVSEAKAALTDSGAIVHVVLSHGATFLDGGGPGVPVPAKYRHEQMRVFACNGPSTFALWSATTGPDRWRVRARGANCESSAIRGHVYTAGTSIETAYGDGATSEYIPSAKVVLRTTELVGSSRSNAVLSPIRIGFTDGLPGADEPMRDPVERIRRLLTTGSLRDAGKFRAQDGRQLWRLRGTTPSAPVGGDPAAETSVEYVVDASTFKPVTFTLTYRPAPEKDGKPKPATAIWLRFDTYERLPITPENERLLKVQAPEGTPTETLTSRQVRAFYKKHGGAANDPVAFQRAKAAAKVRADELKATVEAQIRAEERTGEVATTP